MVNFDFNAPTAIGISGQRSLTSKTMGLFFILEYKIPGMAMVRGVLVANTRSAFMDRQTFADLMENEINEIILLKNTILFE